MSKKLVHTFKNSVIRDITTFGGLPFYATIVLFLLLLGNMQQLVLELVIGILIIMTIAILIRSFYYKPRPKELPHKTYFEKLEASSFPSIHAARAWFLAFVFANFFQNKLIWSLLIISAFSICYSRHNMRRHDFWDLLVGSILGIVTFLIIVKIV